MSRRLRHSLADSLRALALVVFVIGVLLQPAVAMLGEMHELNHDAQHAAAERDTGPAGADEGNDAGSTHELHHFAHCCGHHAAIATNELKLPTLSRDRDRPLAGQQQRHPDPRLLAPFRPPITA